MFFTFKKVFTFHMKSFYLFFFFYLSLIFSLFALDISDTPVFDFIKTPPSNLMFLIDNSQSMDFELFLKEEGKNTYPFSYIFKDKFNYHKDTAENSDLKAFWEPSSYACNYLYYNPFIKYRIWPATEKFSSIKDADPLRPRFNPLKKDFLFLKDVYLDLAEEDSDNFAIKLDDEMADKRGDAWEKRASPLAFNGSFYLSSALNAAIVYPFHLPATGKRALRLSWPLYSEEDFEKLSLSGAEISLSVYDYKAKLLYKKEGLMQDKQAFFDFHIDPVSLNPYGPDIFVELSSDNKNIVLSKKTAFFADIISLEGSIKISNAHYIVFDDKNLNSKIDDGEDVFLVNFAWEDSFQGAGPYRQIYKILASDDNKIKNAFLKAVDSSFLPESLRPFYDPFYAEEKGLESSLYMEPEDDLQNFANWFQYHRTKLHLAKLYLSDLISHLDRVNLGFYTVKGDIVQPVLNLDSRLENYKSRKEKLLNILYSIEPDYGSGGKKPLREALDTLGSYYARDLKPCGIPEFESSPYLSEKSGGACQKAFTLIVTDALWTEERFLNTGDIDLDGVSETLADIAAYYYKRDLAPDLPDLLPSSVYNQNRSHHMVNHVLSFSSEGRIDIDKHRYWETGADPSSWKWPSSPVFLWDKADKADDLFHASVNSRGFYFNAFPLDKKAADLISFFNDISLRSEISDSSVIVDGFRIEEASSLYHTEYYPELWLGDLKARQLNLNDKNLLGKEKWSAAENLSKVHYQDRKIFSIYKKKPFSFRYENLPSDVKKLLLKDKNLLFLNPEPSLKDLVSYLRGRDFPSYRQRKVKEKDVSSYTYKIGDFVNSRPLYHKGLIYAGANDGMLHIFDALDGRELFAFIPSFFLPDLWELMRPDYALNHRYFLDGPLKIASLPYEDSLRDILIGGFGKGGRGYFAVKLADSKKAWSIKSEAVSEEGLSDKLDIWEFPLFEDRADERDMGYSYSDIAIVRSNNKDHPWLAVFGNGYKSPSGEAVLFILDALTGEELRRIGTGAGGDNGLSSPALVDINADGRADWVYAGDLKGNIWKFDISSSDLKNWDVYFYNKGEPQPLFTSSSPDGKAQPITTKPGIARHCLYDGYMIIWGTGKLLHQLDKKDQSVQTVYGVWDHGMLEDKKSAFLGRLDRSKSEIVDGARHYHLKKYSLVEQEVYKSSSGNTDYNSGFFDQLDSFSNHRQKHFFKDKEDFFKAELKEKSSVGWFFDLPDKGERLIEDIIIHGSYALALSLVPESDSSFCKCGAYSFLNFFESCTGSRPAAPVIDIDGSGCLQRGRKSEDGLWETNDSLLVSGELYPVSRVRVDARLSSPSILHGGSFDRLIALTSKSGKNLNIVIRGEGEGLFYWRIR